MAVTRKPYPRATLKKILKAHTNKSVSRNADALVYLDYCAFLHELMRAASRKAKESGDKRIEARHIRKITMTTLRRFRG